MKRKHPVPHHPEMSTESKAYSAHILRITTGVLSALYLIVLPLFCQSADLTIGIGRSFYDGPESPAFLHGSTRSWEALVDLDDQLRPIPWLALSWTSDSERRVWTFTIRQNVFFHNGELLRAQHVVESIKRLKLHPKYDPMNRYEALESVEAIDDVHVVFKLSRPCVYFPNLIAYYGSPILHPSSWDEKGRIKQLIATGPYKLDSLIPDRSITLVRHDKYWGSLPPYDRLVFRVIQDSHSRVMALITGSIDAIVDVGGILPDQQFLLSRYRDQIILESKEVATTHYLLFNTAKKPSSDRNFRLWLAAQIDRQMLVDKLMKGFAVVAKDPYSRLNGKWSFSALDFTSSSASVDPSHLPTHNLTILLHANTVSRWPYREMAQIIDGILRSKGITSRILVREKALYLTMIKEGEFHITIQPFTMMTGDPDCVYSYLLPHTKWNHAEAEKLIVSARKTPDETSRPEIYRRLEKLLSEEVPLVPLFHDVALYAYRTGKGPVYMDALFRPVFGKR